MARHLASETGDCRRVSRRSVELTVPRQEEDAEVDVHDLLVSVDYWT